MVSPKEKNCGAVWLNAISGMLYYFFLDDNIPDDTILDFIKNEKDGVIDSYTTFGNYTLFNNRSKVEVEGYAFCRKIDGHLPSTVYKYWPFDTFKDICTEPTLDSRQFEKVIFVERTVANEGGAYVTYRGGESGACSLGFKYERWLRCKDETVPGDYQYFNLPHQEDFMTYKPKNSDKCSDPSVYGTIVPYTDELFDMLTNTAMSFKELNERLLEIITPKSLVSLAKSGLISLPLSTQTKVGSE